MKASRRFKADSKLHVGVFYSLNGLLVLLSTLVLRVDFYLRFLVLALALVVLVNLVFAARTWNWAYLFPALNYLLVAVMIWSSAWAGPGVYEKLHLPLVACFAANLAVLAAVGMKRKLKWRREEMLELAAQPVIEKTDGFTARPFTAGRVDCSDGELAAFARFLFKHLLAVPYWRQGQLVLVLARRPMDHVLKLRQDGDRDTWVVFDAAGNVTVSIVRSDYLHYTDEYAFDLLCASLGRLFGEFLDLHRSGRKREIISRLDALRLPPFTGALVGF